MPNPARIQYDAPEGIPGLIHIGHDRFTDAVPAGLEPHAHRQTFEVCLIQRGTLQWWIGERSFAVGPGELFLTLPDEPHGGHNGIMERCELYWVGFLLDHHHGSFGLTGAECTLIARVLQRSRVRVCPGIKTIAGHFQRIFTALAQPGPMTPAVVRASLALLLDEVRACFERTASSSTPRTPSPRIARATAWMQSHLEEPHAIAGAAAQTGLSPTQFRAVVRQETGCSPQELLTQLRVVRAKELLRRPRLSITQIALDTGFGSSQYFATAFRRATGFTPGAWRTRAG